MLERDALLLMEFDDDIVAYKAQPISIQYKDLQGNVRRYTPDILFKRKSDGAFGFREVKMAAFVSESLNEKVALINRRLRRDYKSDLEIITDREIRVGSTVDNLKVLYSYRRICIDLSDADRILCGLPREFRYADLISFAKILDLKDTMPLALLAHGFLCFEKSSPLLNETRIFKP
ncbi:MAG: hypothetical protein E6Q69_03430 [Aquipseudomonas alcaligenes]|uniref:TnsA endonuclease N-terminal domain-containing protein n=1 Tax=Aquipseudomonas alcaligenes TaxID=43263 RepID=A0A5C7WBZ8_AQUAC|nr:MAG: hypothetical protein E6Q69_03430 [Pseudomonas alcaligenes]